MSEEPKRTRLTVEKDGFAIVPQEEFQTFAIHPYHTNGSLSIHIPKQIQEALQLTPETILQVAIKQITREECQEQFRGLPKKTKISSSPPLYNTRSYSLPPLIKAPVIDCPVCHNKGSASISKVQRKHPYKDRVYMYRIIAFFIRHNKGNLVHYVSKKRFPDFWLSNVKQKFPEASL
jgi:hypothetical protein